jgi:hypothetical protein
MMRISKSAPNLLKKAATSVKSKADALRTKLIFMASLRRRLAMVCAMSRQIRALVTSDGWEKHARVVAHGSNALTMRKVMVGTSKEPAGNHGGKIHLGLFEVAMFEEGFHGYPDSASDICYKDGEDSQDDDEHDDLDVDASDETSVIEMIKRDREAGGLEFNMDADIDEACEMFIRRCRGQMNLSF